MGNLPKCALFLSCNGPCLPCSHAGGASFSTMVVASLLMQVFRTRKRSRLLSKESAKQGRHSNSLEYSFVLNLSVGEQPKRR